ncbi:putative otoferlin [Schistosoma mansoni]|uniref:putative otoferlin n=1 Tax=Schistosoma mansoni TaxID=6183 RepID=UPI00022DC9FD|nr:putative otoferlin [Schistosoma mansoni]|eukprot:XP_018655678.1 putative otoferlin [Schistosoma mansoni]
MSLILDLKYLVGLTGKGDRRIKVLFREAKLNSRIATGHDSVYFGQRISWPVSRSLDDKDVLILKAYQMRKGLPDSTHGDLDDDLVNYPLADTDYRLEDAENVIQQDQPPPFSSYVELDDDFNQIIDRELALAGGDEWEVDSQLSAPERKDPRILSMLGPTIYKSNQFQKTVTKYSTNCPFYDNYFAFDFARPKISVLTEIIRIRVFNMRSHPLARLLPGKLVGEFITDVQTVYNEKDHAILNKWAVIIDPRDPWKGPTGYVKVDMHVIEEGHQVKVILCLFSHLLLPRYTGMTQKRIMLSMKVSIYQAEDLPPMNTEISDKIRKAFVGENTPNLDSYVEVSYAGHTARTKTEKYNYNPIWNETIEFCDYFPSFTRTIRINVRNGGLKGELIATRLIDIRDIMCHITGRNFPHFGPSWINLYGTPRIYTYAQMLQPEVELNQALGEGVAYRGRLLLAIRSMEDEDVVRIGTSKLVASPVSETVAGKKSLYFLFACFSEASVIEKKLGIKNKPISYEISFGLYGNQLDGKRGGVELQTIELAQPNNTRERVDWCYSTTTPLIPTTDDKEYYYLNFGNKKPCLYLTGYYEDHRSRMCIPNILEKLSEEFYYQIQRVKHLFIRRKITEAKKYLRTVFLTMAKKFSLAQESIRSCRDTASTTLLDREYSRRVRRDLRRMALLMINLSKQVHRNTLGEKIKDANALHSRLCHLSNCPQDGLPDVFISMILERQRVGFVRIPARDIYYSAVDCERGKWSGQMATLYLRKQGREGVGHKGWRIQSQIRIYLWLGLIKDFTSYTYGLPGGYDKNIFKTPKPPNELVYLETSRFQFRCYIFIARDLIASDSSGMSDPMARILIGSHVLQTQVLYQTMSPMWDVVLYKQVTFYQNAQSVKQNLQEVIVEIFDIDPGDDPQVPYENLPTFEELAAYTKEFDDRVILKTLDGRFVLFWDMFWSVWGMVRQHLLPVKRPRVVVEIGGHKLESEIINDLSKMPLFETPLKAMDVYLPVDERYWPPLVFTCFDNRILGTKITIGSHTISNARDYLVFENDGQLSDNASTIYMDSETDSPGKLNFNFDKMDSFNENGPSLDMLTTTATSTPNLNLMKSINNDFDSKKSMETGLSSLQLLADMNPTYQKYTLQYKLPNNAGDLDLVSLDGDNFNQMNIDKKPTDALPGQAHLVTTHSGPTPEQLATADWWTRFYVTIRSGETNFDDSRYKGEVNPLTESEDSDIEEKLEKIDVKSEKDSEVALEEVPDFNGFNSPFLNLPFYKGKQLEDHASESRITGFFKGNLVIYPVNDDEPLPTEMSQLKLYKTMPTKAKFKLTVRLYVIRAIKLHPTDPNGKSDPYLIVSLGKCVINDRDDYKPKTLNPVFGKYYEFVAHLPMDSLLSIQMMDHERVGSDTLIGETHIDIENRFHSAHRATCGLMPKYYAHGYCQWKDSQQPTEILANLCKKYGIEQPVYNILENKITIGNESFFANTEIRNETGITIKSVEPLALEALHNWSLITKKDVKLVSEHVETRSLKHPDNPGLIQGRLQMWIDMFEREVAVPPPAINISPRVPTGYELRVIVWNTADVKLTDASLFSSERSSDIYVKGWVKGVGIDDQKTDVHYRSLSGEGNFNWRFIFPFDYIKAEDRITYPIKGTFDIEPHTIKANCELTLQVWDADIITSDNFIGSLTMRLSSLPRCAKTAKSCGLHQLEPDCPRFSMFKNRTARGWWPVTDEEDEEIVVQGKVECQLEMLNSAEAESNPAGLGREEPNGLPKPDFPGVIVQKMVNG